MRTLRTAKTITTLEAGVPELSFRVWYEAQFGAPAYEAIDLIATKDWIAYVDWFARQAGIAVEHETRLRDLVPEGDGVGALLERGGEECLIKARRIVLCTGVGGLGGPYLPNHIFAGLPKRSYAHTAEAIDFAALRGARIGVLGAGSSAFDAAATALEAGAGTVELFSRGDALAQLPDRPINRHLGAQMFFADLPDARKLEVIGHSSGSASVPAASVARAQAHSNFTLHLSAPWIRARYLDGRVHVETAQGQHAFDFLIAGTGYSVDLSVRPELQRIAPYVALWKDRAGERQDIEGRLGKAPYIRPDFSLAEKKPGTAPFLSNIYAFNAGASLSFSRHVGDIGHQSIGVPRLSTAIARSLFLEDYANDVSALFPRAAPPLAVDGHTTKAISNRTADRNG